MDELDKESDHPPSALDVTRRALILCGVVCRASLEDYTEEEYRRETTERIHEWFAELDLWQHLEPCEERIIRAPFGQLPWRLRLQGTWFVEGLAILSWALRRIEFPPHDQKVHPNAVTNALDFLAPRAKQLLASPTVLGLDKLRAAREWFYDVHCTLRQFLSHGGEARLAVWIGEYVARLGLDPKGLLFEGSLAVDGGPLVNAERERLEVWESVICERHRAAIWLVGEAQLYTELTVDT